jgi:hypothetical protein
MLRRSVRLPTALSPLARGARTKGRRMTGRRFNLRTGLRRVKCGDGRERGRPGGARHPCTSGSAERCVRGWRRPPPHRSVRSTRPGRGRNTPRRDDPCRRCPWALAPEVPLTRRYRAYEGYEQVGAAGALPPGEPGHAAVSRGQPDGEAEGPRQAGAGPTVPRRGPASDRARRLRPDGGHPLG